MSDHEDITRDILWDCLSSFVHGDQATEITDFLLSDASGLCITEATPRPVPIPITPVIRDDY